MKKSVERLKSALIVLLVLLAAFMAPQIQPLKSLFSGMNINGIHERLSKKNTGTDAVFVTEIDMSAPMRMAYTSAAGRLGLQYSSDVYRYYEAVSTTVSEALGSATGFEIVEEAQWREALGEPGLYLDYGGSVPAQVLAAWLGVEVPAEMSGASVSRILLSEDGVAARMYIMTDKNEFYRCGTAVRFSSVSGTFGALDTNGAEFAFEDAAYSRLAPYTMVLGAEYAVAEVQPSVTTAQDTLFKVLAFNQDTATPYLESDGTVVYVENDCTVRVSQNGGFSYKIFAQGEGVRIYGGGIDTPAAATAAVAIGESTGLISDGVRPYINYTRQNDYEVTVVFGCTVNGIPVYYDGRDGFMTITVTDGVITYFDITMLTLTPTEGTDYLMPENLAQAAAYRNSELVLAYLDDGRAVWMI